MSVINLPENKDILLLATAFIARVIFFVFGIYQDANFTVKYTDIDYFVFHDASGYVYTGLSPYLRDTYRYTPLLSWLLVPNYYLNWLHFGKLLFVIFDLLSGVIIKKLLSSQGIKISSTKILILSSIWLLNPMVITISTRGNAESVLCFLVLLSLYYLQTGNYLLSGLVYGLSIHFKIYPIIYSLPIAIYIFHRPNWFKNLFIIGLTTLITIIFSGALMYSVYGTEFLEEAYFYHIYRTDHRHNFSIWNILLYFDSAINDSTGLSKFAFIPQMLIVISISFLEWNNFTFLNLLKVLFMQTFAFVTFNKVCTSQYFIWYLIFLPFPLANTTIKQFKGVLMIIVWAIAQAVWLYQAYLLEFEGQSTFVPGIFTGSILFFVGNIWILGQFIQDFKTSNLVSNQLTKIVIKKSN